MSKFATEKNGLHPMKIESLVNQLKQKSQTGLPGELAQYKMAPYGRAVKEQAIKLNPNPKLSAVMVLLFPDENEIKTVLIKRNEYPGMHSKQISFPGGKKEPDDQNLWQTAQRETFEEVGVSPSAISFICEMSDLYIPPSGFLVQPYLAFTETKPNFVPHPIEVTEIINTPISYILSDASIKITHMNLLVNTNNLVQVPYFDINGHIVWGATAMILSELREMCSSVH
jgi:8-oxo-dGTP pyrophosphatase MutT (NUDIX family)